MEITAITETSPGRYKVHLEDGREIRSTLSAVSDLRIFSGRDIDDEQLEEFILLSAKHLCVEKGAELLSVRQMSGKELKEKLLRKGYDEECSDFAVSRLYELGMMNDAEYSEAIVRHYASKGYGIGKIRAELSRRGISRDLWEEALEAMPESDDKIDKFISSRLKDPTDRKQIQKISASLYRRGYGWDEIRSALKRYTEEDF